MAGRVRVREITGEEGNRLLRIVRRSSGSAVTWRRAQMVLLSAQGMDVPKIASVAFTSPDRVREVIHNFNDDRFDLLYPRYWGGDGHWRSRFLNAARSARLRCLGLRITGCRSLCGVSRNSPTSSLLRGWLTTLAIKDFGSCSVRRTCHFK